MNSGINVYALSGREAILKSLRLLLENESDICLSGFSVNFKDALKYYRNSNVSRKSNEILFIDDISFDKFRTLNFIHKFSPEKEDKLIKPVVYTDSTDAGYLSSLISTNVTGILQKSETPLEISREKFILTIKLIGRGFVCYDNLVRLVVFNRYNWAKNMDYNVQKVLGVDPHEKDDIPLLSSQSVSSGYLDEDERIRYLSKREKEILLNIAQGKKNQKIADELNISPETVGQHKVHIIQKLGLKSSNELIVFALVHKNKMV